MNRNKRIIALVILIAFFSMVLLPSISFAEEEKEETFKVDGNFSIYPVFQAYGITEDFSEQILAYVTYLEATKGLTTKEDVKVSIAVTDENSAPDSPLIIKTRKSYIKTIKELIYCLVELEELKTKLEEIKISDAVLVDDNLNIGKFEHYEKIIKAGAPLGAAANALIYKFTYIKDVLDAFKKLIDSSTTITGYSLSLDEKAVKSQILGYVLSKKSIKLVGIGTDKKEVKISCNLDKYESPNVDQYLINCVLEKIDKKIVELEIEVNDKIIAKLNEAESKYNKKLKEIGNNQKKLHDIYEIRIKEKNKNSKNSYARNVNINENNIDELRKFLNDNRPYMVIKNDLENNYLNKYNKIKQSYKDIKDKLNTVDEKTSESLLDTLADYELTVDFGSISSYLEKPINGVSKKDPKVTYYSQLKKHCKNLEEIFQPRPDENLYIIVPRLIYAGGATKKYEQFIVNPGSYSFMSGIVMEYKIYHAGKMKRCGVLRLKQDFKLPRNIKEKSKPDDFNFRVDKTQK